MLLRVHGFLQHQFLISLQMGKQPDGLQCWRGNDETPFWILNLEFPNFKTAKSLLLLLKSMLLILIPMSAALLLPCKPPLLMKPHRI